MIFIYDGNDMVTQIRQHQDILNLFIGMLLLLTALFQIKKMVTVPAAVHYGTITKPA